MILNTKVLKKILYEKNIRQADLARMTGIPRNSLSRYVSGHHKPSFERLSKIADALGVPYVHIVIEQLLKDSVLKTIIIIHTPQKQRKYTGIHHALHNL